MTLHYAPSTGGFYDTDLHTAIPEDAVPITKARHAALLAAQADGASIVAAPDTGKPIIQRPRNDATTRRHALAKAIKREAARRIDVISPAWRQMNDMREPSPEGEVRFVQIDALRAASNAIEAQLAQTAAGDLEAFPVAANPLWPLLPA